MCAIFVWEYEACGYLEWVDLEWQERARTVIGKLVEELCLLPNSMFEKDAATIRMKEERTHDHEPQEKT